MGKKSKHYKRLDPWYVDHRYLFFTEKQAARMAALAAFLIQNRAGSEEDDALVTTGEKFLTCYKNYKDPKKKNTGRYELARGLTQVAPIFREHLRGKCVFDPDDDVPQEYMLSKPYLEAQHLRTSVHNTTFLLLATLSLAITTLASIALVAYFGALPAVLSTLGAILLVGGVTTASVLSAGILPLLITTIAVSALAGAYFLREFQHPGFIYGFIASLADTLPFQRIIYRLAKDDVRDFYNEKLLHQSLPDYDYDKVSLRYKINIIAGLEFGLTRLRNKIFSKIEGLSEKQNPLVILSESIVTLLFAPLLLTLKIISPIGDLVYTGLKDLFKIHSTKKAFRHLERVVNNVRQPLPIDNNPSRERLPSDFELVSSGEADNSEAAEAVQLALLKTMSQNLLGTPSRSTNPFIEGSEFEKNSEAEDFSEDEVGAEEKTPPTNMASTNLPHHHINPFIEATPEVTEDPSSPLGTEIGQTASQEAIPQASSQQGFFLQYRKDQAEFWESQDSHASSPMSSPRSMVTTEQEDDPLPLTKMTTNPDSPQSSYPSEDLSHTHGHSDSALREAAPIEEETPKEKPRKPPLYHARSQPTLSATPPNPIPPLNDPHFSLNSTPPAKNSSAPENLRGRLRRAQTSDSLNRSRSHERQAAEENGSPKTGNMNKKKIQSKTVRTSDLYVALALKKEAQMYPFILDWLEDCTKHLKKLDQQNKTLKDFRAELREFAVGIALSDKIDPITALMNENSENANKLYAQMQPIVQSVSHKIRYRILLRKNIRRLSFAIFLLALAQNKIKELYQNSEKEVKLLLDPKHQPTLLGNDNLFNEGLYLAYQGSQMVSFYHDFTQEERFCVITPDRQIYTEREFINEFSNPNSNFSQRNAYLNVVGLSQTISFSEGYQHLLRAAHPTEEEMVRSDPIHYLWVNDPFLADYEHNPKTFPRLLMAVKKCAKMGAFNM